MVITQLQVEKDMMIQILLWLAGDIATSIFQDTKKKDIHRFFEIELADLGVAGSHGSISELEPSHEWNLDWNFQILWYFQGIYSQTRSKSEDLEVFRRILLQF